MDWHLLGNGVAALECALVLAWLSRIGVRGLRKLPVPVLIACLSLAVGTGIVAQKTNGVNSLPPMPMPQVQQVQPLQVQSVAPASVPNVTVPSPRASADMPFRARAWNRRGAWDDSFRCAFPGEWVFPHGTCHLDRVEVCSQGRILPRFGSPDVIASVGFPLQIVNPITSFGCGPTASNSYVFAWTNAVVGRVTREDLANAETVNASIELFRNGDVAVTTNGVTELRPRVLPFPRNGYGQDDEWVTANFTNATEILAVGYPQWVDAQVGEGLTNGLYKFTATVPEVPPETIQLKVGNCSVAVTNAGDYVFLLEKGVDYDFGMVPFIVDAAYSAADDVPHTRGGTQTSGPDGQANTWSVDGGRLRIAPQTEFALGRVVWLPLFFGSPDVAHVGPGDGPVAFTANFAACRAEPAATYSWSASPGIAVQSPSAKTTAVTFDSMPSWAVASVSVTATFGTNALVSVFGGMTYGTNDVPQVSLTLDVPEVVLVCTNSFACPTSCVMRLNFVSDCETNGTVRLCCVRNQQKISIKDKHTGSIISLPSDYFVNGEDVHMEFYIEGVEASEGRGDVELSASFVPLYGGTGLDISKNVTVADIWHLTVSEHPKERDRTILGVGECVMFYYSPNDVSLSTMATLGEFYPPTNGMMPYYSAHEPGGADVSVFIGPVTCSLRFTTVAPTGFVVEGIDRVVYEAAGYSGLFDMTFHNCITPTNVSFYGLEVMEIPMVATNAVGYFAQPAMVDCLDHGKRGAGKWGGVGYRNESDDIISAGYNPTPWMGGGSYTWPIPVAWRCRGDLAVTNVFAHTDQRFELDADGTARVYKFGYCGERTTNNTFNLNREIP